MHGTAEEDDQKEDGIKSVGGVTGVEQPTGIGMALVAALQDLSSKNDGASQNMGITVTQMVTGMQTMHSARGLCQRCHASLPSIVQIMCRMETREGRLSRQRQQERRCRSSAPDTYNRRQKSRSPTS